ncbi:MAG: ABC transporter ATP-binding protein [Nitrococcus sp.]|nr:ABC transporter ATP-binding protein [Nitrococcus sp.]
MTEVAVTIKDLGHAYLPGKWVFRHYSAGVEPGRVSALLGPNGCGKSTLLRLLLGGIKPAEGTVEVSGRMAFVPQLFHASFDYTVIDMVLMGRARHIGLFGLPSRKDKAAVRAALNHFGLAHYAERRFHELSGGQRQMVILARALVAEADILVLDEPTSALDLKNQALILDWITRLAHGMNLTVIFTTHHPHHVLAVADQALLMLSAETFVCGATATVLTEDNLGALYGVPLKHLSFEHAGQRVETLAPVFPRARAGDTAIKSKLMSKE